MKQNISIVRGRSHTFNITVKDASGNPYVLQAGEKMIFGVKRNYNDSQYLCTKQITSANATQTSGVYAFSITPSDTCDLMCGEYCYDIGLQSSSNYFTVVECSNFKLNHNVTRMEV